MKESHTECDQGCYPYELSVLVATHESKQYAIESPYSCNTFSFNSLKTLKEWLTSMTLEQKPLVCSIRLVITCRRPIDEDGHEYLAFGWRWRQLFADEIGIQLPNLRSMNMMAYLSRPVNCWRRSQTAKLNGVFSLFKTLH